MTDRIGECSASSDGNYFVASTHLGQTNYISIVGSVAGGWRTELQGLLYTGLGYRATILEVSDTIVLVTADYYEGLAAYDVNGRTCSMCFKNMASEHGIADREPNVEFRRTSAFALVEIVPSYQDQAALFNTLLDHEADPEVKAVILNYAKNGAAGNNVVGQPHPSQDAASSSPAARASLPARSGWSWRRYESDSGGYSAEFPAKPVFDKTNLIMDDRTKKITAFASAQPQSGSTKENLERAIDEQKRMFREMLISSERTIGPGLPRGTHPRPRNPAR